MARGQYTSVEPRLASRASQSLICSNDGFPVLKVVPGVTALTPYDRNKLGTAVDLNKIGLYLKLDTGSGPKMINVHFSLHREDAVAAGVCAHRAPEGAGQGR